MSGLHDKIRTLQRTNQNSPFHPGQVQPYDIDKFLPFLSPIPSVLVRPYPTNPAGERATEIEPVLIPPGVLSEKLSWVVSVRFSYPNYDHTLFMT